MVIIIQPPRETAEARVGQAFPRRLVAGCFLACGVVLTSLPVMAQSVMLLADSPADLRMGSLGLGLEEADYRSLAVDTRPSRLVPATHSPGTARMGTRPTDAATEAAAGLPGLATPGAIGSAPRGFDPSLARPRIRTVPAAPVPTTPIPIGGVGAGPATDAVRTMPRPMVGPAVGVPSRPLSFPGLGVPRR